MPLPNAVAHISIAWHTRLTAGKAKDRKSAAAANSEQQAAKQTNIIFQKLEGVVKNESCLA